MEETEVVLDPVQNVIRWRVAHLEAREVGVHWIGRDAKSRGRHMQSVGLGWQGRNPPRKSRTEVAQARPVRHTGLGRKSIGLL